MPDNTAPSSGKETPPNESKDGQKNGEPEKRREIRVEENKSQKSKSQKEQEREKFKEELRKKEKALADVVGEKGMAHKSYADVRSAVEAIDALQNEIEVTLTPAKVDEISELLVGVGKFSSKAVASMSNAEMMAAAQVVLKYVEVDLSTDVDTTTRLTVEKAQNASGDEEMLVDDLFKVSMNIFYDSGRKVHGTAGSPFLKMDEAGLKAALGKIGSLIEVPDGWDKWQVDKRDNFLIDHRLTGIGERHVLAGGAFPWPDRGVLRATATPSNIELASIIDKCFELEEPKYAVDANGRLSLAGRLVDRIGYGIQNKILDLNDDLTRTLNGLREIEGEAVEGSRDEMVKRQEIAAKYRDFDSNLGVSYMDTRDAIKAFVNGTLTDTDGLMARLRAVKGIVDSLQSLPTDFDLNNRSTWPRNMGANYRFVFEVTRAFNQAVGTYGKERVRSALSAKMGADEAKVIFIGLTSENTEVRFLSQIDGYFRFIHKNLSDEEKLALAGDIEANARVARSSITSGWTTFNRRMTELYEVFMDVEGVEGPGHGEPNQRTREDLTGIRLWKGLVAIDGVDRAVRYAEIAVPPEHWQDSAVALDKFLRTIQTTGLGIQDMQSSVQQAYQTLSLIPLDIPEGAAMYALLRRKIEAFKFKQTWFIIAHQKHMDPEQLERLYEDYMEGVKEETFEDMIDWAWRDVNGRDYYALVDVEVQDGDRIKIEKKWQKVNLFDVQWELYSERLVNDRIRMNIVEEMTKIAIDTTIEPGDERWTIIRDGIDYVNLPDEWSRDGGRMFREEMEKIRTWMVEEFVKVAADTDTRDNRLGYDPDLNTRGWYGLSITEWARESGIDLRKSLTKHVVEEWYQKNTLHGAPGTKVNKADAMAFVKEFENKGLISFDTDDERNELAGRFTLMAAFDVRRWEMKKQLLKKLQEMNLSYDTGASKWNKKARTEIDSDPNKIADYLGEVDFDSLEESGGLSAVDADVSDTAWIIQWSAYNCVRIYGREESKYHNDIKAVVLCPQTDIYDATMIDHPWEFFHEDNEARGRPHGEEVNRILRQYFPGKNHYFFSHVSMAVRFIPSFLTTEQNDLVERKTAQIMNDINWWMPQDRGWRAAFRDYIKGVAKTELFESGAISFTGAKAKFSDAVKQKAFTKFHLFDNASDRNLLKKVFGTGAMQSAFNDPEAIKLYKLLTKEEGAPSTRNERTFPLAQIMLKAQWKLVSRFKHRFFDEPDVMVSEMERFIDGLVGNGYLLKEQGEAFKRQNLGLGRFGGRGSQRWIRSTFWDEVRREHQVSGGKGWLALLFSLIWIPISEFGKAEGKELQK